MTKSAPAFLCVLPWIQQSLYPNAQTFPCCLMVNDYSLGEFPNIDQGKLQQLKDQMLAGEVPKSCEQCSQCESAGIKSYREHANQSYPKSYQEILETRDTSLVRLELRLSNRCNFSCRTCNVGNSTGWYKDAKFLGNKDKLEELNLLNISGKTGAQKLRELANSVDELHFMGGEPLLQPEHFELLKQVQDQGQVSLFYVTNLSHFTYTENEIQAIWGGFKKVVWDVSLDALGEKAQIIRKGKIWSLFEANLKYLLSLRSTHRFEVGISLTVSALNYGDLPAILDYCEGLGIDRVTLNTLYRPEHYSIQALGLEDKIKARQALETYLRHKPRPAHISSSLQGLMAYAQAVQSEHLEKKLRQITHLINELRSEKLTL